MEKLIYPVWKDPKTSGDDFARTLRGTLAPQLLADGNVRGVRLGVSDSDMEPAAHRRMENSQPAPDGLVSVWVNNAGQRAPLEQALANVVLRHAGYLVTEAEPLMNTEHPSVPGERGYGMYQVVFLQRPPRLSEGEWLQIWQGSHTQVAIDTQSTFGYRQNVIVRPLTYAAPQYHAMIEEYFPPEAMASDHAFYAAENDEQLAVNSQAMIDSVTRFIDFDKIDCIPMSEYLIQPVTP